FVCIFLCGWFFFLCVFCLGKTTGASRRPTEGSRTEQGASFGKQQVQVAEQQKVTEQKREHLL
ncbi:hypothetical protein KI387_016320, partial [Taxus chinensis]